MLNQSLYQGPLAPVAPRGWVPRRNRPAPRLLLAHARSGTSKLRALLCPPFHFLRSTLVSNRLGCTQRPKRELSSPVMRESYGPALWISPSVAISTAFRFPLPRGLLSALVAFLRSNECKGHQTSKPQGVPFIATRTAVRASLKGTTCKNPKFCLNTGPFGRVQAPWG